MVTNKHFTGGLAPGSSQAPRHLQHGGLRPGHRRAGPGAERMVQVGRLAERWGDGEMGIFMGISMDFYRFPSISMEFLWISMEILWISMEF